MRKSLSFEILPFIYKAKFQGKRALIYIVYMDEYLCNWEADL